MSFCYVILGMFFDYRMSIIVFLFFFWIWLIFLSRKILHISETPSRLKVAIGITSYLSVMSIIFLPIIFILLFSFGFRLLFFGTLSVPLIWAIILFVVILYITHAFLTASLVLKELGTLQYSTYKMLLLILIYPIGLILLYDSLPKKEEVDFKM